MTSVLYSFFCLSYDNLSYCLLNINHELLYQMKKQRNFTYFGFTTYKSGYKPLQQMIGGNLGYDRCSME